MHRGAGRRLVFRDDGDRYLLIDLLAELDARFGLEVHAYCLMGNHLHLLVRSREPSLSSAMQWMMSTFTKAANVRRGVDGPIFRGRFHSIPVERPGHLDWLFRYINANPRDMGWREPLVEYPWSGLAATVGRAETPWLRTDYVRERFGAEPSTLLRFVDSPLVSIPSAAPAACDLDTVASAAEIASAPGPGIHSRADVRRVVAVVGVDVAGCSPADVFPLDASVHSQRRQLSAARDLIDGRPDLERFHGRVLDVLRFEHQRASEMGERRLTPFADTGRDAGSVAGHV